MTERPPKSPDPGRRAALRRVAGGVAGALALARTPWVAATASPTSLPVVPGPVTPEDLAADERFWQEIGTYYDRTDGIVNLEHGFWGKMARPVQDTYLEALQRVNRQSAYYARREYGRDYAAIIERVAGALGVEDDEIVLTRNATESIQSLVLQYRGLERGDAVLYADVDYPSFKVLMRSLEQSRGVRALQISLAPRASQADLLAAYVQAFDENPGLKLILLTHVSNQHGLVLPVQAIAAEARQRGIDVICDSAQSWGLVDYKMADLGVDWAGFNLHKWIGAPLGVGALYMRRGSRERVAVHAGERSLDSDAVPARIHSGTINFAAFLAVPAALDFHAAVGGANKEARLRHLRGLWTSRADKLPHIEVLGGLDEPSWTGMASFRLRGKSADDDARALQQRLEQDFGIFTVARFGLASGACVRVTPQVFTSPAEISLLANALEQLAG